MQMYLKKSSRIGGGAICALFAALLLQGCGGYFSGQWPNLAEGFKDAAERDAALASVSELVEGSEATAEPAPQEADSDPVQEVAPGAPTETSDSPEPQVSPEFMASLQAAFDEATGAIAAARQAYEEAKGDFTDGTQDGARGRWLTAQLKLTGLSRAGDGLNPVLEKLQPAARECGVDDMAEICDLSRRVRDAATALGAYLTQERLSLTAQDPAGPS